MWPTLLEADDWSLEISEDARQQAWANSRAQSHASGCWTAYLNRLAVHQLQKLINADLGQNAVAWPGAAAQPEIWEVTTGSALTLGQHRLIIIPSTSIDTAELSVPQEWVDIPSWVGDYYVAVKIDPTEESLQVLGYATHRQLKAQGEYDAFDRTYGFPTEDLIPWDSFSLTYTDYGAAQTQAAVAPVEPLSANQTTSLLQRLGQPTELLPRLEVPFQQWAALLENPQSRRQLYQARHQSTASTTKLAVWLNKEFQDLWETVDSLVSASRWAGETRGRTGSESPVPRGATPRGDGDMALRGPEEIIVHGDMVFRAKQLSLSPEAGVVLSVGIAALETSDYRIVLKIDPTKEATALPENVVVRLLSPDSAELGRASAVASETIRMQFLASPGEEFKVEVSSGENVVQEHFAI